MQPDTRKERKRERTVAALGGLMYALFSAFGWQMQHEGKSKPLWALLAAGILTPLFGAALARLFEYRGKSKNSETGAMQKPFCTARAFAFILLCYVPMYLITFPGSFAYDSPFQLRQAFTGEYSTHHPLLHTLLLGGCVRLGQALGSINMGAALYTAIQMALLAGCFALTCASVARRCGAKSARRCAVVFAIYPLHMLFAVNATKDVLFGGLFALTLALAYEAAEQERQSRALCEGLILAGAAMILLRNNALYAAVVWIVLLVPALGKRRGLMLCALTAAVLAMAVNSLLAAATGAQKGNASEMLSWPIQQMARARLYEEEKLTGEEKAAIDELMPGEAWRNYDPTISDPVKFEFDTERFKLDLSRYLGVYVNVGLKCPKTYFDAVLALTYPFFYPYSEYGVSGYYLQMGISREQIDQWCSFEWISSQSLFPRVLASLTWRFGAKGAMQIPGLGYLFNTGVIVWAMFYLVLREAYFGRWRRFAVGLLPVLLWGTFLLGPVMAGRYVYPFVCALPVMACRANPMTKKEESV